MMSFKEREEQIYYLTKKFLEHESKYTRYDVGRDIMCFSLGYTKAWVLHALFHYLTNLMDGSS